MAQVFNSSYSKRLKQENHEFKANLGYLVKAPKCCFKTKSTKRAEDRNELDVEHLIGMHDVLGSIPATKQNAPYTTRPQLLPTLSVRPVEAKVPSHSRFCNSASWASLGTALKQEGFCFYYRREVKCHGVGC